jgi:hypothetical protein
MPGWLFGRAGRAGRAGLAGFGGGPGWQTLLQKHLLEMLPLVHVSTAEYTKFIVLILGLDAHGPGDVNCITQITLTPPGDGAVITLRKYP